MYPVWRYRTRSDGVIVYNEAQDAEAFAAGYVPADEVVDEPEADVAPDGLAAAPELTLLELTAQVAAAEYWSEGKATKSELYLVALWLGADVAADATVDDMKGAIEPFRPVGDAD